MAQSTPVFVLSFFFASWTFAAGPCSSHETAFFACSTARGQRIGLCGRLPQKELQYRFGTDGRMEFRFPVNKNSGVSEFLFAHYVRYRTSRFEIRFSNRDVSYAVFDYEEEEGERFAGVRVVMPNGSEHDFNCAGHVISRLGQLRGVLRCDPDSALNMMGCP